MKNFALSRGLAVCCLLLLASASLAGDGAMKSESGWFDFENCSFCKNLAAEEGLLEHCTWETHPIKDGMMTIITLPAEYEPAFAKAEKAMAELGMKIQNGEVNPMTLAMCGSCQQSGMLMMGGQVKMEEVRGDAAMVSLMTSEDATVVAQLHQIAKRNMEEMGKMMAGADHGHGHDH